MELRNTIIVLALRTTVRFAWAVARSARTIGSAGEALERAVDRQATRSGVATGDVLGPLVEPSARPVRA